MEADGLYLKIYNFKFIILWNAIKVRRINRNIFISDIFNTYHFWSNITFQIWRGSINKIVSGVNNKIGLMEVRKHTEYFLSRNFYLNNYTLKCKILKQPLLSLFWISFWIAHHLKSLRFVCRTHITNLMIVYL